MSAAAAGRPAGAIVGRNAELARLRAALDTARGGRPTIALVVGDAGIGKSSLIAAVVGRPVAGPRGNGADTGGTAGVPVLVTASGDEAEADLDYGVLDQLARAFPVDAEPRAALPPEPGAEPHRVGAEVLRLVDATQLEGPLVVVVDDAQWADRASLEALTFAARRLRADAVLLCVACRPSGLGRLPPGLVRLADEAGVRIELGPLDTVAVAELARRKLGQALPAAAAQRLRDHTGGNPLHTCTLLDELPFEALARPESLPAPRSYAALVLSRLATCSPAAQDMLTALSVLGMRARLADVAEVAGVDAPLEAVDELVERGLAQLVTSATERVLAFPHGLVQASVAVDLSPSRRAALHRAAATVTGGEEALRHRLAAAHGPEPELVTEARAAAERHLAGRKPALAARLLLDAAPLAASAAERRHLVVVAASYLVVVGQPLGALADDLPALADCAHRSFVLGHLALRRGAPDEAGRLLARAWEQLAAEPGAGELAGPVADLLALLAVHEGRLDEVVAWARRAREADTTPTMSATLLCHGLALQGDLAGAEQEMGALLARHDRPAVVADAHLGRGIVRLWTNDLAGADDDLADAAARLEWAPFLAEVHARSYRAEVAFRAGRWSAALDLAEAAASLADDAGEVWLLSLPHGVAAAVHAAQGRVEPARRHAEAASGGAAASGLMPARLWAAHAWFRVVTAGGDHAEVAAAGDRMVAEGWDAVPEGVHHWRAAYVESLVAVGRLDAASAVAAALTAAATAADAPADLSVETEAARARGVAAAGHGDQAAADEAFAAGLALDPERSRPLERALLELAAGAHQRRTGRRRAAADLLAAAADRFDALGAAPWHRRAARELERCGRRPKKRSDVYDNELTAQERLVANLAAGGLTNREVASELVISIKTVEHHLSRIYTKLGLRSRTELAAHLPPPGPSSR